ncbi:hypothetical protein MNBD_PLANCTO02-3240 [hydrothermal vent metagenome]|uniref:Twin-arginine translocation protein TatA n=1 Tax=hydrothermal vent metagenome TaxID=652676 RepID=A0A3B1DMF4_9ZZZZ
MLQPLAFFGLPGYAEVMIVGFIALLLFGNRLPNVMGSLGKSIVEFKKGVKGIEDEVKKGAEEAEASPAQQQEHQESAT